MVEHRTSEKLTTQLANKKNNEISLDQILQITKCEHSSEITTESTKSSPITSLSPFLIEKVTSDNFNPKLIKNETLHREV